jgi:hypothetical protein
MLLPIVFEQLRAARSCKVRPRPSRLPAAAGDPGNFDVPTGIRYQLFRALRAMAHGQRMIVQHRLPVLPVDPESRARVQSYLKTLRDPANWRNTRDLEAIYVPGTAYSGIAGPILLRSGWCAPSDQAHHIPNLRTFLLTERGYETLEKAWAWWSGLGFGQRLRLMLTE